MNDDDKCITLSGNMNSKKIRSAAEVNSSLPNDTFPEDSSHSDLIKQNLFDDSHKNQY